MALTVSLEAFEGPLDLLLHLISVNQVDIYDIPIAVITEQYLNVIREWTEEQLSVTGEFIVMAARLMEIKSQMLLPRGEAIEEVEDPREKLVQQLLDHRVFKEIATVMQEKMIFEGFSLVKDPEPLQRTSMPEPPVVTTNQLYVAYKKVLAAYDLDHTYRRVETIVEKDPFTVEDKLTFVRERLISGQEASYVFSSFLSDAVVRSEVVALFRALLELYRLGEIEISQSYAFSELVIRPGKEGAYGSGVD